MTRLLRPWQLIVAAVAFGLAALLPATLAHEHSAAAAAGGVPAAHAAFRAEMRRLWEDHIVWTRMVIVSAVHDLPDRDAATERLLRNQDDIGDAIEPFYGEAAGEQLSALLREHIVGAAVLLDAAIAGDGAALEEARVAWYANGDEIADFLASANPSQWPQDEMRLMMRDHLDLTLAEAVARLEGRHADDVAAYDEIHRQILHMADMLSDGIIAAFPADFAR